MLCGPLSCMCSAPPHVSHISRELQPHSIERLSRSGQGSRTNADRDLIFRADLRFARSPNMKIVSKWIVVSAVISLAAALCMISSLPVMQASADHVRWDIQHFNPTTTPSTSSAGGVAFASARNPSSLSIKLTGSGTFVGPASGGTSGGVTGGGTWETFSGTTSTGSGTYEVTELVSWQFARFGLGTFNDVIDDGTAANGNAVLRIRYSDGSEGTLGIGCEGPGPNIGIVEGVIATKDHVTYWNS